MATQNLLCVIPIYRMSGDNWFSVRVVSDNENSFSITTNNNTLVFNDEELKPNGEGQIILDLRPLGLQQYNKTGTVPTEFEFPLDILEHRAKWRQILALKRNSICIERGEHNGETYTKYFYLNEEGQLIIKIYDADDITYKEAICEKIEVIHGKKAVNADGLGLFPYIVLPAKVIETWEKILREKELKGLALVLAGKSLLDGKKYYGFNLEPSVEMWSLVEKYFVYFGNSEDELNGWLTCTPVKVAERLGIAIDSGF